jgi:hypothetical protein
MHARQIIERIGVFIAISTEIKVLAIAPEARAETGKRQAVRDRSRVWRGESPSSGD